MGSSELKAAAALLAAGFAAASAGVAAVAFIPLLRKDLLPFGKTLQQTGSLHVPRSWFVHFYVLGSAVSAIVLAAVCMHSADALGSFEFNLARLRLVALAILPLVQTLRRLSECVCWPSPPDSYMHAAHYAAGIAFYTAMPLATVVDGLARSNDPPSAVQAGALAAGTMLFVVASIVQHMSHKHLADLRRSISTKSSSECNKQERKKYPLPTAFPFTFVACPHYACEIAIYAAPVLMTMGACPAQMSVLFWVIVELSIAADAQFKWYANEYQNKIHKNWRRLVPLIY